jgi:hypothetical protein
VATNRPTGTQARLACTVLALILLAASAAIAWPGRSRAQSDTATPAVATPVAATPGTPVADLPDFMQIVAQRPAEIVAGSCAEPGETLATLTPLEVPAGEARGQGTAIEAERSYTSVGIPIASLVDGQTSIRALLSEQERDVVIACGEIGGVLSEGGSIVIKLSERSDSGFVGIVYLGAEDAGSTGASAFLAGERTVADTRELIAAATPPADLEAIPDPSPTVAPTPTAEPVQIVDVVLLEWLIDMPQETRAGRVNFVITNEGGETHGLVVASGGVPVAELPRPLTPGASTVLETTLFPGDYEIYCPLGDGEHRADGMETTLTVVP